MMETEASAAPGGYVRRSCKHAAAFTRAGLLRGALSATLALGTGVHLGNVG
jgi:hypothetical protein